MLVGSKWYRFDFHSHSSASDDYAQLDLTEREWLLSYMRKSVDAVVLTDHNTGKQADKLKAELELMRIEASTNELPDYRPLVLFPGVELTATGDVHVIAMFDEDASSAEIEQLIGQCNVNAPIPRGRNDATVLQGSVPTILANIAANPNILSILAHLVVSTKPFLYWDQERESQRQDKQVLVVLGRQTQSSAQARESTSFILYCIGA